MAQKKKIRLKRKALVEGELLESEAFRLLSKNAMWVLLRFLQKRQWTNMKRGRENNRIYENGNLVFTYTEAAAYGLSGATFYRSIKSLVDYGFLDVEHRGGTFGHGEIKDFTRFKLVNRWKKWGTEDFVKKEFEVLKFKGEQIQSRIKNRFQN